MIDAKNQETVYTYDSYNRVTEVQKYPTAGGSEDTCQQVNYSYDSNPYDGGSYSTNALGRLAAVQYMGGNSGSGCNTTFQEWYNYGSPGGVTGKRMHITRSGLSGPLDLAATFGYDMEGRMINEGYPTDSSGTTASLQMGYDSMA